MNFQNLIETGDGFAQIAFLYKGLPETGMMAWLDGEEMRTWWKADDAIIEPYPGGRFYVTWSGAGGHAICGVIDGIDDDRHTIDITKIFYIALNGKLGPLHLQIRFEQEAGGYTKLCLRHTHNHQGQLREFYNNAVHASWPKTFGLLKKYLERNTLVRR